jgi:hypothetical protein
MCLAWVVSLEPSTRTALASELAAVQIDMVPIRELFDAFGALAARGQPRVIIVDRCMPGVLRDAVMNSLLVRERLGRVPCIAILLRERDDGLHGAPLGPAAVATLARTICGTCCCDELAGERSVVPVSNRREPRRTEVN